jgi:hypothetical protein
MKALKGTRLLVAALALVGLSAVDAAAQAPVVTWQQIGNTTRVEWSVVPGAALYDVVVNGSLTFNGMSFRGAAAPAARLVRSPTRSPSWSVQAIPPRGLVMPSRAPR